MAYTVLARKYRSQTFDEVVGQDHVAQTLKKAIASDRVAHAYLFCGTRGTGKTSMARILAKALNCESANKATTEPCLKCSSCKAIASGEDIDVIEIDAASNTQVDKTREVILDNAQFRPARSRFKIYIIDEVHMLSKASFNALLKTLEEPPEHVKFILATTEPEKVLPTILSRCQRYDFRNIPTREIAGHLKQICKDEKIKADEDAVMLVAKAGAGSMRDALSLLDRLLSIGEKQLTVQTIEQLLGLPRSQLIFDLVQAIGEGRVKDVLTGADRMICEGQSVDGLLVSLIDHFRNLLILRTCGPDSGLVEVVSLSMDDLSKQAQRFDPTVLTQDITILEEIRRQLRQTQAGRALLDAILVRLALAEQFTTISDLLERVDHPQATGVPAAQKKKYDAVAPVPVPPAAVAPLPKPVIPVAAPPPPPPPAEPAPAATPSPQPQDEDDDLPRPGKVWDGPSLSEVLKQQSPKPAPQPTCPAASNVEPVADAGLAGVWHALLDALKDQFGLHSLVSGGRLAGIEDGQAVIRYTPDKEQFPKMLSRNGKRETVTEILSRVLGRPVGVRFEVDEATRSDMPVPAAPQPPPTRPQPGPRPSEPEQAAPAPPPPAWSRPTPEQVAEFERDPLIGALLSELNATIVRISED